jgi:hypothetical protein
LWSARFDGEGNANDGTFAMTLDANGNVLVTGYSTMLVNDVYIKEYVTIKYDSDGKQLWTAGYHSLRGDCIAYAIAVDHEQSVIVTGMSGFIKYDSTAIPVCDTVKYDANGNHLWTASYNSAVGSSDSGKTLDIDSTGNIYIAGTALPADSDYTKALLIRYSQSG